MQKKATKVKYGMRKLVSSKQDHSDDIEVPTLPQLDYNSKSEN